MSSHEIRSLVLRAVLATLIFVTGCGASLPRPDFQRFDHTVLPTAGDYPDVAAVVLLNRGVLTMSADPRTRNPLGRLRHHRRIKVLRDSDPTLSEIIVPFERANLIWGLKARVVFEGSTVYEIEAEDFQQRVLSGRPALIGQLDYVVPGAVIEVVYDLYIKDLRFIEPFVFADRYPTKQAEFALVSPPGWAFDLRFSENGRFVDRPPDRFDTEEGTRFFWSVTNIPARFDETNMPARSLMSPRAHVLYQKGVVGKRKYEGFASWTDVGTWFEKRVPNWSKLRPATIAEAKRIAGDTSPEEQALKLLTIVARDLEEETKTPQPLYRARIIHPDRVLEEKKANPTTRGLLLVALLRAIGIPAEVGLFAYRDRDLVAPDVPTFTAIGGVVAVIPRRTGPAFLNPSELSVSMSVPPPRLQGTRVVALSSEGATPTRVPISAPQDSSVAVDYLLELGKQGGLFGKMNARLTGAAAGELRRRLQANTPEAYATVVSAYLAERDAPLVIESVSIADLTELRRPLVINGSIRIEGVAPGNEEDAFLSLSKLLGASDRVMRETRRSPLVFGAPTETRLRFTLSLPEDFQAGTVVAPIKHAWKGGRTEVTMRKETDRRFGIQLTATRSALLVQPGDYAAYRRHREKLRADVDQPFSFKRPPDRELEY